VIEVLHRRVEIEKQDFRKKELEKRLFLPRIFTLEFSKGLMISNKRHSVAELQNDAYSKYTEFINCILWENKKGMQPK